MGAEDRGSVPGSRRWRQRLEVWEDRRRQEAGGAQSETPGRDKGREREPARCRENPETVDLKTSLTYICTYHTRVYIHLCMCKGSCD